MKNKNAFTLVELMVVMAILVMMAAIMIGVFNSIGITNKGRDAQRKKDLNRIKVAFEEYFNDNGYYPKANLVAKLMDKNNCKEKISDFPNLDVWPCDPSGNPYITFAEDGNRFRIITNLENKKDKDIPDGWYLKGDSYLLFGFSINKINYGVSSSNILWYEELVMDYSKCRTETCWDGNNRCSDLTASQWNIDGGCKGNCYYQPLSGGDCIQDCWVGCCGYGCE